MLYAVIPAGGSGTRLWPLSRADRPKFLLPLTGTADSLLQATLRRVAHLSAPEATYVVTGASHAAAVARQLPALPDGNILVEPSPRDSSAAIGLAAAIIARRDPTAVMGSFAADHLVADEDSFRAALAEAVAGAEAGWLMTVGMRPTFPSTGFGYVQCGAETGTGTIRKVLRFKEKPDLDLATRFVDSGDYLWNASMFVWRVDVFLAELRRQAPELHDGLVTIAAAWDGPDHDRVMGETWPALPKIAVEYSVMEGAADAGLVATVPGDFGWSDVGDYKNLAELSAVGADGNVVVGGAGKPEPYFLDVSGTVVVPETERLVVAIGVRDAVIVDTADVLLVCARDRVQDVKKVVDGLRARGDTEHL